MSHKTRTDEAHVLVELLGNIARATHFRADDTCHHVEEDCYTVPKQDCDDIEEALAACDDLPEPEPDVYVGDGWNRAVRRLHQILGELHEQEARLDRLTGAVQQARLYAGDNLPAAPGLTIVSMLERALREDAA
ncbi:hypothetical protein [Halomonas cerina]|uniref:Uncharacterized protein n=1 Tax=Halomonas cerina TaxID=447424 RepID=A0A839VHC4_9GAMM|nr:hypothetical protein [Halomonas cerina]MBB3192087.1 hypothetical protein [Halomonas cerina]